MCKIFDANFIRKSLQSTFVAGFNASPGSRLFILRQNRYCLLRDAPLTTDALTSFDDCGIPNLRRLAGPHPVYGMGQPGRDGLATFINRLKAQEHSVTYRSALLPLIQQ